MTANPMVDLDTALRAADFHVPDAAKVIREHLEALWRQNSMAASQLEKWLGTHADALPSRAYYELLAIQCVIEEKL